MRKDVEGECREFLGQRNYFNIIIRDISHYKFVQSHRIGGLFLQDSKTSFVLLPHYYNENLVCSTFFQIQPFPCLSLSPKEEKCVEDRFLIVV